MEALHVLPVSGAIASSLADDVIQPRADSGDLSSPPAGVKRSVAEQIREYWQLSEELERLKLRNALLEVGMMAELRRAGALQDEVDRLRRQLARGERKPMKDGQPQPFDQWGIVEVMGHKRYAGHITEQQIAGAALVRVDVPEVTLANRDVERTIPAYSKLVGVASIYCVTPTTEEIARQAARELARYDADPLPVYIPEQRQLAAASVVASDASDDEGDDWQSDFEDDELP